MSSTLKVIRHPILLALIAVGCLETTALWFKSKTLDLKIRHSASTPLVDWTLKDGETVMLFRGPMGQHLLEKQNREGIVKTILTVVHLSFTPVHRDGWEITSCQGHRCVSARLPEDQIKEMHELYNEALEILERNRRDRDKTNRQKS